MITPLTPAYNARASDKGTIAENHNCYHFSEASYHKQYSICKEYSIYDSIESEKMINTEGPARPLNGLMDSPWPMYCHDVRHTGRSPYSTANNHGTEKWRYPTNFAVDGYPVIDSEGTIYIGSENLFAVYPNGTLKWKYVLYGRIKSAPAIDENGIIYVGTIWAMPNYLYAIYTSNGTLKWKYQVGDSIFSSPAIGDDGSIYFGSENDYIYALYPNGTLKWRYLTSVAVYSSPAIGDDGTVYCGSHDGNLYAFYPNNGTLKWFYHTGDWVGRGPSIADDGTVYFGSWDGYLYAVYPDGTLKWKTGGNLAGTTPVTAQDGTIYVGNRYLSAIYPNNGSVKWTFDPGPQRTIRGGNPCISADGTIFFGTHIGQTDGGELIAVNPDGTERWRIMLATDWIWSAPAIGSDGTVYVGSSNDLNHPGSEGYLHAIGKLDSNAPSAPEINGPASGKVGTSYDYTFESTSPLGRDVYYYIDWGDNTINDWFGPYAYGETVTVSHTWGYRGTYTISSRAKDTDNLWGPWGTLSVTMPLNLQISQRSSQQINQHSSNQLFLKMLQRLLLNIS
jgi:outer membrane protein assembly factor BamB